VRLALELGFSIDESVFEQGRRITLSATAAERSGAEFLRITDSPGSLPLVRKLLDVGRLADILPELAALLDDKQLREHSLRTYQKVEEIIASPGFFAAVEPEWTTYFDRWGVETLDPETATTEQPLPFRRGLLKLAGLLHDIAKPETRFTNTEGEVHFYGHDSLGARTVGRLARERLRLSRAQSEMLTTLTAEHMRLHLLATSRELTDRAVRRFWSDLGTEALGLMVLCVADGWATAGRTAHLEDTIARMVAQKRTEDAVRRIRRLVTGDDLIALGLTPGPVFKVILQELEDLQIEGRITTKEDGIAYLKTHLAAQSGPGLR
jgi:poly(A) polymerase